MAKKNDAIELQEELEREAVEAMLRSEGWKVVLREWAKDESVNIENLINSNDEEDEKLKGAIMESRAKLVMIYKLAKREVN